MTSASGCLAAIDEAIFVDEVGIGIGILGDFRLKSAYQPIFSRVDEVLVTAGMKAVPACFLHGRQLGAEEFRSGTADQSAEFADALFQILHLRNYRNIGLGGVDLFVDFDPRWIDPGTLLACLPSAGSAPDDMLLHPEMLVCECTTAMQFDGPELEWLTEEMRWKGIRVALSVFGIGQAGEDEIELLRPDVVRVNGGWFEEMCRDSATARLFAPIVSALQDQGAKVLVEGIDNTASLRIALDANVDLLQGDLLAPAALAGTVAGDAPLPVARLLSGGRNVIPLFG